MLGGCMTDTKAIYVRLPTSLVDQISAVKGELSVSDAICNLLKNGLLHDELRQKYNSLSSENQNLKVKSERIQGELLTAQSQLNAAHNAIRGLRGLIQVKVAKCKTCGNQMSLQDLMIRTCINCRGSSFDLLDEYKGTVTGLQAFERVLAIVGGIYLASQVLGDNQ
jgi:FtsZ-binding cell division protein ZapB